MTEPEEDDGMDRPLIFLIQWGPKQERDEITEIGQYFEPMEWPGEEDMDGRRICDPNINALWNKMDDFLSHQTNPQLVYFSAHGDNAGHFMFSRDGKGATNYEELMGRLESFLQVDCVHLVLGSCYAMGQFKKWSGSVPSKICQVTGFWPSVDDTDVAALMAGVIENDGELFGRISKHVNDHLHELGKAEVVSKFEALTAKYADPTQNVRDKTQLIVSYTRDADGTKPWQMRLLKFIP